MNRRKALESLTAASGAVPLMAADPAPRQYYELRYYQLRNGVPNTMPSARPAGVKGTFGAFTQLVGESSPFLLTLFTYSSFAEAERVDEQLPAMSGYVRYNRVILRAFPGMPALKLPPASPAGHIFELRTYDSNDGTTLRRKMEMFDNGERQIFERLGMNPVFFGEALVGDSLPHLTYMLAYEDFAARDRMWKAFGADPEWQKLRAKPGLSDADIVSNIRNIILRPTAYSDIR